MFQGIANLASLMRQAQQMSGKMQSVNEQLKARRAQGVAGGGLVQVEVNGLGELLRLQIDPVLVERGDREMIEDLAPAAVNQALERARQLHVEAMQALAKDLDVPALKKALSQLTGADDDPVT